MTKDRKKIALAEALRVHDERVKLASDECQRLRRDLELSEARRGEAIRARKYFMRYFSID